MKVERIMERAGLMETGKGIAYIKDALEEINKLTETVFRNEKIDITKDQVTPLKDSEDIYLIPFIPIITDEYCIV